MTDYKLFMDETGSSFPAHNPQYPYVLVGVIIEESKRPLLRNSIDAIKKKHFGRTSVVFHSADIGRNTGDFQLFRGNPSAKKAFIKDLLRFLDSAPVIAVAALVDKTNISPTWIERTIVSKTARSVVRNFIFFLFTRKNPNGQVIIESATSTKDLEYLKAFGYFVAPNCADLNGHFTYQQVRNVLTSISFVTKNNNDPEEQIADLLSYGATSKYKKDNGSATFAPQSYEAKLIKILEKKLFKVSPLTGAQKLKYFSQITAFEEIK